MTGRATRAAGTAAKLASKGPVFIAGAGLAVAGIAAAVFGISRQREAAVAAGELVKAADAGITPAQAPDPVAEPGEMTSSDRAYRRDLTSTPAGVEAEKVD
ncbi:MAG: hypothetical protein ACTHKE_09415 [Sphingomicrobium sp.]